MSIRLRNRGSGFEANAREKYDVHCVVYDTAAFFDAAVFTEGEIGFESKRFSERTHVL